MPLRELASVRDFLRFAASSLARAFLIGVVLTIVAQSSATVSIIAVTMTNVGMLTIDQTIVIVLGASLGSGISIALLSTNLSGVGRQIAYLQIAVKLVGVAVILPLFIAEYQGLVPGVKTLVFAISHHAATQVALVYLLLQIVSAVLTTALRGRMMGLIARMSPPTVEEMLSKPHYLYDEAVDDPMTALDLVEREQMRLFGYLPGILDAVRVDGETSTGAGLLHSASVLVARQCDEFLTDILDRNSSREVLLDVVDMQKRNEILIGLIDAVYDYVGVVGRAGPRPEADGFSRLLFALGEGLHTILTLAGDAFASKERDDIDMLLAFTSDRSTQMERIRRQVLEMQEMGPVDHSILYASTTLFERMLWLIRRYAALVEQRMEIAAAAAAD
jgi:phosphate:Na+ symporter